MSDKTDTGSIIVLRPTAEDPTTAASSQPAHLTMIYLGMAEDLTDEQVQAIRAEVAAYAKIADGPITAAVTERTTLGDEDADVLLLEGQGLVAYREGLLAEGTAVRAAYDAVEQFDPWKPHVTLGYPEEPALADYDEQQVEFDKIGLWVADKQEDFMLGEESDDTETETEEDIAEEEMAAGLTEIAGDRIPVYGVLAPTGVMSGDRRMLKTGGITHRQLPIPLQWVKAATGGHDNQIVVANIEEIFIDGNLIKFSGFMASTREAAEVVGLRAENMLRGVSVDLDRTEATIMDEVSGEVVDLNAVMGPEDLEDMEPFESVEGRIASATICAIPAFEEAFFNIGTWADAEKCAECPDEESEEALTAGLEVGDYCVHGECRAPATVEVEFSQNVSAMYCAEHEPEGLALAAKGQEFAPGTKDGPGWVTNPKATARIRRYWVKGKGAAKIQWGVPGDFNRCRSQLAKYVQNPDWLAGLCANMHKEALGIWPGQHSVNSEVKMSNDTRPAPAFNLVDEPLDALVAGASDTPAAWFRDPEFQNITPLTIDDSGRIYGHMATWSECHIGREDRCITAPHSQADYAYFLTGVRSTDGGEIPVGHITMDMGHAPLAMGASSTLAHYDNTEKVVADVVAGEDAYGIWVAGALRPGVEEERVERLRGAVLSGDWRRIRGNMELVATLAVNVPGFPVPRIGYATAGTHDSAMVAAGMLERHDPEDDNAAYLATIVEKVADVMSTRAERQEARRAAAARIRQALANDRAERLSRIKTVVGGE